MDRNRIEVVLVAEQLRRRVPGGIGTYIRGLIGGLRPLVDVGLTLWASRAPKGADPLSDLSPDLSNDVSGPDRIVTSSLPGPVMTRAWDRGFARPRHAAVEGVAVVHAPSFALPPRSGAPLTVMVHDLAWRHEPEAYPARGRRWHEAALRRAIDRGDLLMVPSTATADDLLAAGAVAARVEVVPEGCDHLPPPDHEAARLLLSGLGVEADRPYVLTVSTIEPRKNLSRLVEAHALAQSRRGTPMPLVVVGPPGWGPTLAPRPNVVIAGAVTGATLAGLYAGARVMASVPLREGFGLPAVEAMRAGTPVVASPMPSIGPGGGMPGGGMPSGGMTSGDGPHSVSAAKVVDPLDVEAIATALADVADDESLRSELVDAGRRRAAELTWDRAARRHVELWRALGGPGGGA